MNIRSVCLADSIGLDEFRRATISRRSGNSVIFRRLRLRNCPAFFFFVLLLRSRCTLHRLNRLERLTDSISCVLFSSLALMRHTIRAATGALLPIKINQSVHQQETLRCHTSNRQFSHFSARVLSLARRPERSQHFGRLIFLCSALCLGSPLHAAVRSFLLFFL